MLRLRQARKDGVLIRQLMQRYGLSKASVYRYLTQEQVEAEAADELHRKEWPYG